MLKDLNEHFMADGPQAKGFYFIELILAEVLNNNVEHDVES